MHRSRIFTATAAMTSFVLAACGTEGTTAPRFEPTAGPSRVIVEGGVASEPVSAEGIVPKFFSGNDNQPGDKTASGTCARLTGIEGILGAKLDDPGLEGTLGGIRFERSVDNISLGWTALDGVKVELVSMKGGNGYNLYGYDQSGAGYTSDEGLASPKNASGTSAQISHVLVCYTHDDGVTPNTTLAVTKTVDPKFRRTYTWDLLKQVSDKADGPFGSGVSVSFPKSGSFTTHYRVKVDQTGISDDQHAVSGTITVLNPGPAVATVIKVEDNLPGATVSQCTVGGSPVTLPSALAVGGTMECPYSASLADGAGGVNSATVTASGTNVTPVVSSIDYPFSFTTPTVKVNETITVTDAFNGGSALPIPPGTVSPTQLTAVDAKPYTTQTYTYTRSITIPSTTACGGTVNVPNTAALSTGQESIATVTAKAECGCTPGYWSNTRRSYPFGLLPSSKLEDGMAFGDIASLSWFDAATFTKAWTWSSGTTDDDMKRQMSRHGAAALLNAGAVAGFKFNKNEVIDLVKNGLTASRSNAEAIKNTLQAANEAGCPLPNR